MAIIPQHERTIVTIIHCPVCNKYYRLNYSAMGCLVQHGPGSCCHFGDTEIAEDKVVEVQKLLGTYIDITKPATTTGFGGYG